MEPEAVRRDSQDFAPRIILCARTFFALADGGPAFLVPNALVQNLPGQTTVAEIVVRAASASVIVPGRRRSLRAME